MEDVLISNIIAILATVIAIAFYFSNISLKITCKEIKHQHEDVNKEQNRMAKENADHCVKIEPVCRELIKKVEKDLTELKMLDTKVSLLKTAIEK